MAKGKYAKVVTKLPKYQEEESEQKRINAVKDEILKSTPRELTAISIKYVQARREKDVIEEDLKAANLVVAALTQLVCEQYSDDDAEGVRLKDGSSIFVHSEPYASVKDPDRFRKWCIEQGLERKLQLPWATTNELTKDRLLKGQPEPPGVEAWNKPKVSLRGRNAKEE